MSAASITSKLSCFFLFMVLAGSMLQEANGSEDEGIEFFEKRIRPVLVERCYQCHSALAEEVEGNLRLDYRQGILQGGDSGPVLLPGHPSDSLLLSALRHDGIAMPPDEKLPDNVIADFEKWIELGAPDPRATPTTAEEAIALAKGESFEQLTRWWSLQPVVEPQVPATVNLTWPKSPIDRFVLAKLETVGLEPQVRADRRTLLRRLSFVLRGLPPSDIEIANYLSDACDESWKKLVDRMLASPHFGEHWARHWMDVVRYSDTYGYEWDIPAKGAWRYRDYLIRALNADVPVSTLMQEQIAGDLLPEPRINDAEQINESLIGTMFFQMGEKRHGDSAEFDGIHQEMLDNKIDAFSKAFQGLTISCARCHDHKIDPILQAEYYALGGIFMSSRWVTNTADLPTRHTAFRSKAGAIKEQLRALLADRWKNHALQLSAKDLRNALSSRGLVDLPLDDNLHPWAVMQKLADGSGNIRQGWSELASKYQTAVQDRKQKNAGHFAEVVDFRNGIPEGWSVDGVGLQQLTPRGDFTVALAGDQAVGQVLYGGLVTNTLSPKLNGAVRTPYLNTLNAGHLSFEVAGGEFAASRAVVDNAFLTERQQYVDSAHPKWVRLDGFPAMKDRHVYLEFATKTSNPNFPPRVGLGGACTEEQAADPRSWFAISRVVRHVAPFSPEDELARFKLLFAGDPPDTLDEVATRYSDWLAHAVEAWTSQTMNDDDVQLLNAALELKLLPNQLNDPEVASVVQEYRELEKAIAEPWTVNGMADLDAGFDIRLNTRGDYASPSDLIARGYLKAVTKDACDIPAAKSGRLQLAQLIVSSDNPLTARVFVNRVWQWLFGTGLVATSNDFGHLGERPSNPELLDYLANRFVAEGWSLKKLVREILLSETWQQSSDASEASQQIDPANRLLSHFSARRLEAEAIRDSILFASGELVAELFGSPINPYRQNEDSQKRLFSGPIDGFGRRSIYTKVTIMEPPRLLALFNQPPPKVPTGVRDVTNTPAQALALLNDEFTHHQAEAWARKLVVRSDSKVEERLDAIFTSAYGRPASEVETSEWKDFVAELASTYGANDSAVLEDVRVWKDVVHAVFNTAEFIHVR